MDQHRDLLTEFLQPLLTTGKVVFRTAPIECLHPSPGIVAWLRQVFADYRLSIAGPPLDLCEPIAWQAAEFVRHSCWLCVHRELTAKEIEELLTFPKPRTAAEHLSADLFLRFVPHLHRRCRAITPSDPLVGILTRVLRDWPLSGVLSDVEDPPLSPLNWNGHSGLAVLYAERLARNSKHDWLPEGKPREIAECVFRELGAHWPVTVPTPDARTSER